MCGINGFILNKPESDKKNIDVVKQMNSFIVYRGPDDEGIYANDKTALGMRRLSIIDLSTGNQPIFNEDRTKVIVFNGEIYNFISNREELIKKGHTFTTHSDTEVVLHSYEEYGVDCLSKLNGMFAFAIYDMNEKSLFIGRDRAGEKPLYYYKDNDKLVFASELKSIIKVFDIKKEINKKAINTYFSLTYIPAPMTIFEGINKLDAASFLVYKNNELIIQKYWDIKQDESKIIKDYEICKKKVRDCLFDSVEKKMISDVPLGAFLSGGIDSSIIVGTMAKISKKPIETFTIGFHNKDFDESKKADVVAKFNKTNHHLHYVDYSDAINYIDTILTTFDEPFADSSSIPTYFVSKFAAEHVKVVLTGDGGDELFGGYSKYLVNYYTDMYKTIPKFLRKNLFEKLINNIPDKHSLVRKIKKVISSQNEATFSKRKNLMMLGIKDTQKLLNKQYYEENALDFIDSAYNNNSMLDELSRTLYTDVKVVLEGDMLTKVDRMSMLNSIESRVPLLDKNMIELAFNIPSEYKIKGIQQKIILKEVFSDFLPSEILLKGKQGFGVPIGEWFKGPLKNELLKLISPDFIAEQNIFNYEYIEKLFDDHIKEKSNNAFQLWTLFVFQNWYLKYYISI